MKPKAHVSENKKEEVKDITNLINKHSIFGIVDITNLPSSQLQTLRAKLKDNLLIKTTKKRLIKIVLNQLKESKKNIGEIEKYLDNCMPALVFTNLDTFKLSKTLLKNKSNAPAKAGQIAPRDLVVLAGPTSFTPGPIIGELGQIGIKAGIESGKVIIKEDSLIVEAGKEINSKAADILSKLNIKPMEVGLNLRAVYEKGLVYFGEILRIDEQYYINEIKHASNDAFSLAVGINYINKETVEYFIKEAYLASQALGDDMEVKGIKIEEEFGETKEESKQTEEKVEFIEEEKEEKNKKQKKEPKEKTDIPEKASEEAKRILSLREPDRKAEIPMPQYSEEAVAKAQEIIDTMKDEQIKKEEKKSKKLDDGG